MKARVLHVILVGALAAAITCALTLPASAELRTVTVRLLDGSVVTVTVDVPPGTPIEDVDLPGVPIPTPPGEEPPPAKSPSEPSKGDEKKPSTREGRKQRRSRSKRRAREEEVVEEVTERARPRRRRHARRRTKLRNPDGSPTRQNPSYFDALPGPSYATGVPNFVIRKFRVPIFLLPIYQAAGTQYGIHWETLAAINEIETDYGRNLNVSSAGAVGWMQFLPSTWRSYGVDANKDKRKDPYNPVDSIFAAARYLKAAGYQKSVRRAIFAYNHADWYVDSVLLRARLIRGVPTDLVGSLTGLTEGRFPVYARARYADDISEREAKRRFKRGENAARVVEGRANRRGIEIYSRRGAPVVATNDGVVKKIGRSRRLGRFLVLQDVYGNRYTYARLDSVARVYPVPKDEAGNIKTEVKPISARRDAKPTKAASAGRQLDDSDSRTKRSARERRVSRAAPRPSLPFKERLFAHPRRPDARRAGGLEQVLNSKAALRGFTTFRNYFSKAFGLNSKDVRLKRLRKGSRVIGGTILGRIGKTTTKAPHVYFEIRPAGRGAPRIDPKPILDGWKLLEATAIYRASGRNALYGDDADQFSIGQVFLLPKALLQKRVLSDPRVEMYPGGRRDVKTGQIDLRVLRTLEYLAERGLRPTVTSLKSGHSIYTKSGNVSHHASGNAVDIAKVNGVPILGHQERGGITEQTVKALLLLQGTNRPDQIISLLKMGGPTFAMGDHADHIHVGFRPLFGANRKLGKQTLAILKPGQWNDLIGRLRRIDNPVVPTKPSKYALTVKSKRRSSHAHQGE
jgi:murein DD-endopeptidase MepM/ murein hydrolase activator NlpD